MEGEGVGFGGDESYGTTASLVAGRLVRFEDHPA
jgi:hypothetical protein